MATFDEQMEGLSGERIDLMQDEIHRQLGMILPNAKVDFAVRKMNRIITVVFDVGRPTRQEFRITVEDVT